MAYTAWCFMSTPSSQKDLDDEQHFMVPSDDDEQYGCQGQRQKHPVYKSPLIVGNAVLIFWSAFLLWLSMTVVENINGPVVPKLYSTMDQAVQYEVRTFNQGLFGERTIYMGTPNNESERAWHDITQYGIIKLDETQVSKLPQSTAPWKGHEGYYVGGVEMFHQLHCLDKLRKAIWAEHPQTFYGRDYKKDEEADHIGSSRCPSPPRSDKHIEATLTKGMQKDHCIDFLRQTFMCHGSTDIITFRYDEEREKYQPNFDNVHVCRKYEPLRDWTANHRAGKNMPDGLEEE